MESCSVSSGELTLDMRTALAMLKSVRGSEPRLVKMTAVWISRESEALLENSS